MKSLLIVMAALGLPLFIVWLLLRGSGKIGAERRARLAASRPGEAVVIAVSSALRHRGPSKVPLLRISMTVHPEGGEPYEAAAPWWVDQEAIAKVQPGERIRVLVGADPTRIYPRVGDTQLEYAWADEPPKA